jgi:alpha-mannosidase
VIAKRCKAERYQTYTSQARIKSGNRTMERLLRELEYFATIASIAYPENYQYPK